MQNIKNWPLFVKIGFGVVGAAIAAAGLVEIPKLAQQQTTGEATSQEAEDLVDVDIIIAEFNTSQPIENVEVRFISKGSPEIRRTDTNGFTQIAIPSRDDIEIALTKQGFQTARYSLNLNNDPNRTRTYYLKPQPK